MPVRRSVASLLTAVFVVALLAVPVTPAAAVTLCGSAPCVVSLSASGGVDSADLEVDLTSSSGQLQISVVTASGSDQDLSSAGVTTSTTITLVIKVSSTFTPLVVVGTGTIDDWTWNDTDDEITITAKPQAVSFTSGTCNLSADCADADFDFGAMLLLATADSSIAGGDSDAEAFLTAYTGGHIATDAQTFSMPSWDSSAEALQFELGAPHLTATDAQNEGFFNILIPEPVWTDLWGLTFSASSPPSVDATADGSSITMQDPTFVDVRGDFPAGWLFQSNTISYSTPTISLTPAAASVDEPDEFDLGTGTTPATTRLPVDVPDTGEMTRQVTLQGQGATIVLPKGTTVTVNGAPFTGKLEPPARVHAAAGGLRNAIALTATGTAAASSVAALADTGDVVFDPPVALTITAPRELADTMRVVRIAPDGSITDLAGTGTSTGVRVLVTGLGTYGLASVLDLSKITSTPSILVALPIDLPADGVIDFATTLVGDDAAVSFAAGTAVTGALGAAFDGVVEPPAAASGPPGAGSLVSVATASGAGASFAPAATLALTPPEGTAADAVGVVKVTSRTATSCLAGDLSEDAAAVETSIASTGTYGLALPVSAAVAHVERASSASAGFHSQWAGQSATQSLCAGQVASIAVHLRNTGTQTWTLGSATPVLLATSPIDDTSDIDSGLVVAPLYGTRLATHTEASVAPGAIGTFRFEVRAPAAAGTYRIDVRAVAEGVTWLEDEGIYLAITTR